jgi:hypothetical protein
MLIMTCAGSWPEDQRSEVLKLNIPAAILEIGCASDAFKATTSGIATGAFKAGALSAIFLRVRTDQHDQTERIDFRQFSSEFCER